VVDTIVRVAVSTGKSGPDRTLTRQAAGSHEIWFNPALNRYTTIPNHPGDVPEGTLRAILKQAGIDAETFLQKK
jgi:hypothetical protein